MNIEVDINDILTSEEIKDIATGVIAEQVRRTFCDGETNLQRLIVNLSYEFVFEMINKNFDGNLEEKLKDKISEVIGGMSSFSVFQRKGAYDAKDSIATIILDEEVVNSRGLIKNKVEEVIDEFDYSKVRDNIWDYVFECIKDNLSRKDEVKIEY